MSLASVAVVIAAFVIIFLCFAAAASRHKKGARGALDLVGRTGTVERELRPEGAVLVGGELWPARTRTDACVAPKAGARVRVVGASGHCLLVEPLD